MLTESDSGYRKDARLSFEIQDCESGPIAYLFEGKVLYDMERCRDFTRQGFERSNMPGLISGTLNGF